jgi:hypothetical protein
MPKPSATVEPFMSAGGPPPPSGKPKKSHAKMFVALAVLVILVGAGAYLVLFSGVFKTADNTPSPTTAATASQSYTTSLADVDSALSALNTNLADVDSSLNDKSGSLSE